MLPLKPMRETAVMILGSRRQLVSLRVTALIMTEVVKRICIEILNRHSLIVIAEARVRTTRPALLKVATLRILIVTCR